AFEFVTSTVAFQNLDNQGFDTDTQIVVTVALSAPADSTVSVNFATSDGTARAGVDYQAVSGTLTFNVGETTRTFAIPLLANTNQTGNLRVNLTLSSPVNASLGFQTHAVATIKDTQPTDNQLFISGLYHDLLGRASDAAGLNFFSTPLYNAETP